MSDIDRIAKLITEDPDIFTSRQIAEAFDDEVGFGWTAEEVEVPIGDGMVQVEYQGSAAVEGGGGGSYNTPASPPSVHVVTLQVKSVGTSEGERAPTAEEARLLEDYFYREIEPSDRFYEYILAHRDRGEPGDSQWGRHPSPPGMFEIG